MLANAGHRRRNLHAGKPAAPRKRSLADALKLGALPKGHAGQPAALRKRIIADAGHRRGDLHAGKPAVPRKRTLSDAGEAGGLGQVKVNLGRCSCCTNLAFQSADGI